MHYYIIIRALDLNLANSMRSLKKKLQSRTKVLFTMFLSNKGYHYSIPTNNCEQFCRQIQAEIINYFIYLV